MKLDDETALSAYLDNELDPDARRRVEEWLAAEPDVASHLADLLAVRGAVAELPRPAAPRRLSSAVLARVALSERARSRRPYYWVATAASLAFGFALALGSGLIPRDHLGAVADHRSLPTIPVVEERAGPALAVSRPDAALPRVVADDLAGPAVDRDASARRRMVGILDRPGLGRILVVPNLDDPDASRRVDDALRETARKNPEYGRLSVAPGLSIDPRHPGGAEVFVAEMDELERREFLEKLGTSFASVVVEPTSDPGLGTQLAELGGISLGTGGRGAGLKPPPVDARVALQHHDEGLRPRNVDIRTVLPGASPFPFPGDPLDRGEVVVQSPAREDVLAEGEEAGAAHHASPKPAGPVPVLIWVTPAQPGG